jgi:hypothetical protein
VHLDEALAIVRQLAEGRDPATGVNLPVDSVLHHSQTIRALYTIIRQVESHRISEPPNDQGSLSSEAIPKPPQIDLPGSVLVPMNGDVNRGVVDRVASVSLKRAGELSKKDRILVRFMREHSWGYSNTLKPGRQCCYCFEEIEDDVIHFRKTGLKGTTPVRIYCCHTCACSQFDNEQEEANDDGEDSGNA